MTPATICGRVKILGDYTTAAKTVLTVAQASSATRRTTEKSREMTGILVCYSRSSTGRCSGMVGLRLVTFGNSVLGLQFLKESATVEIPWGWNGI